MKYRLSLFLLSLFWLAGVSELQAGQYYWINGKGNWSDLTHWQILTKSGKTAAVQVPTSTDTVYFDTNSFTADSQKVTIDIKSVCHTLDWRGSCTKYARATMDGAKNLDIFGSLYFDPGMATVKFNGQLHFLSNNTGNVIDGQSVYVQGANNGGTLLFDGSGSWKFISSWLMNQGYGNIQRAGIVHNTGTLDFNGQTVSAGWFKSASGSTRSLKMDYAELDIVSAHMPKVIEIDQKKLTFSGDGLRIYISRYELGYLEVSAPGLSWGTLAVDPNVFSLNITKSITVDTLENRTDLFVGADITVNDRLYMLSGSVLRIQTARTLTLGSNAILTAIGACNKIIEFRSDGFDSAFGSGTLKKTGSWGSSSVKYASFRNIKIDASSTLNVLNGYDLGANTGVSFTSPVAGTDFFWIGGTGHWVDAKHWSNTSGGSSCGCVPGPTDDVYFDANSFPTNNDTVISISSIPIVKTPISPD